MASTTGRELRSLVRADGTLELSLQQVDVPDPGPDEVLVRVEASPINPSDIGLLLAGVDGATVTTGSTTTPSAVAELSRGAMAALGGRVGHSLPVGNEGAGTVIATGSAPAAQALAGTTVAMIGGGMYAEYRCLAAAQCLPLPPGATPAQGASAFVNPLTALGMVETMRREGHTALVHTAAASNVGQMLNRLCLVDGVPLVSIVRKPAQEELLRAAGAAHIVDSSSPTFLDDLTAALGETDATLAFDAIGGGTLASQILTCMERVISTTATEYSRYGSARHKQVYLYGSLDRAPTELRRTFGMSWGIGGWLVFPFLQTIGPEASQLLRERVAAELTTTFASHYTREISLEEAVSVDAIREYARVATGEKFLINPSR